MATAKKDIEKKVKLKAIHRIKGLKPEGKYTEPKEIFSTNEKTAESLIERGGAVIVEEETTSEETED